MEAEDGPEPGLSSHEPSRLIFMPGADADQGTRRLVSRRLARGDRLACAAVGLGTTVPAEVATFLGHEGSALLGLTAIGGTALILAAVGWIPGRASIGDKLSLEFFEEDLRAVDALAEQVPPDALNQLALDSSSSDVSARGPVIARLFQHALFEQQLISMAEAAAAKAHAQLDVEPVEQGTRWDALLSKGHRMVFVEARLRLTGRSVRELRERVQHLPRGAQLLLVVGSASDTARALLTGMGDVVFMLVRDDGSNLEKDFLSTVEQLLESD